MGGSCGAKVAIAQSITQEMRFPIVKVFHFAVRIVKDLRVGYHAQLIGMQRERQDRLYGGREAVEDHSRVFMTWQVRIAPIFYQECCWCGLSPNSKLPRAQPRPFRWMLQERLG